jgi:hypothetical protein
LYGKDDLETRSCSFGPDAAAVDNVRVRAATVLSGTAFIFRHVFDEIIRLSPAFVDLCEQELASRSNQRMEPTRT